MRRVARRADVRHLILDAVDALLAKFGYTKMTVDDVAKQVGIGKGTIYLHFPSKEELVLAHVDRIAETVVQKLREAAGASDSLEMRLRQMLVLRVLHRFDSVAHYSESLGALLSSIRAPLLVRRQGHFAQEAAVFEEVLREGARLGALDCPDPRTIASVLIQSTNSLLPFNLSARELGRREELEDQVGRIADLLIKGLLPCPSRSPTGRDEPGSRQDVSGGSTSSAGPVGTSSSSALGLLASQRPRRAGPFPRATKCREQSLPAAHVQTKGGNP